MFSTLSSGPAWRRYALVLGSGVVAALVIVFGVAQGALAASFSVSGEASRLYVERFEAEGFVSYSTIGTTKDGQSLPMSPGGFDDARLYNMCQSTVSQTPLGPVTAKLTAGTGEEPARAISMVSAFDFLGGDLTFTNWTSGVDASTLQGAAVGPEGVSGQYSEKILIEGLRTNGLSTSAATFYLKDLKIVMTLGDEDQCW